MRRQSLTFLLLELMLCTRFTIGDEGVNHQDFSEVLPRGLVFNFTRGSGTKLVPGFFNANQPENVSITANFNGVFQDIGMFRSKSSIEVYPESMVRGRSNYEECELEEGFASGEIIVHSRINWNAEETEAVFSKRRHPAEYVVLSQVGDPCSDYDHCVLQMREEQKKSIKEHGDLLINFYIGGDGTVYEGLPQNSYDGGFLGGVGEKSITVSLFGNFTTDSPSPFAIEALKLLLRNEVCSKKQLSPEYKIVSIRRYHDNSTLLGDKLEEELKKMKSYAEDFDLPFTPGHTTAGLFPVVFREEWNAKKPKKRLDQFQSLVKYVVVRDWSMRCFTPEECIGAMQKDQEKALEIYGDVPFNFYLADDGLAYEGRGWSFAPQDQFLVKWKKFIVVAFFGQYNSYSPSPRAFLAFKKLLRVGVLLGKLSPDYKILSFRRMYVGTNYPGEGLHEELKKMDRYAIFAL